MKLMLDTDICIYLIKEHPPSVLERFLSHPVGDIGISSITVAELDYGVSKSRHAVKNRLALAQFLSPLEVASFDRDAAAAYGRLRATLEQKGTPIGSMDLLIARSRAQPRGPSRDEQCARISARPRATR